MAEPRVGVVGAGLAGAAAAAALARRGFRVDLIAAPDPELAGASRLPLGVLHPHLASQSDPLAHVRRQGLRATHAWLAVLARQGIDNGLIARGVLTRVHDERGRRRRDRLHAHGPGVRRVSTSEARRQAGVVLAEPSIFQPQGACIDPGVFIRGLIASGGKRINVHHGRISALHQDQGWQLRGDPHLSPTPYRHLVMAAGAGTGYLIPGIADDITPTRGQATAVAMTSDSANQSLPVSGNGYITPAVNGRHWVGATVTRGDISLMPRDDDDEANLQRFDELWPGAESNAVLERFVGVRASTPDRLPIVDQVARGLWVSVGHGSHGLGTAPLAGLLIASALARGCSANRHPRLWSMLGTDRRALRRARRRHRSGAPSWNRSGSCL